MPVTEPLNFNQQSKLDFNNGYISSDSIQNETCKYFIKKYNLNIVNYNEVKTIMFGSTCNNIILSGGTFSWLIGFFAFYSEVIYSEAIYVIIYSFKN